MPTSAPAPATTVASAPVSNVPSQQQQPQPVPVIVPSANQTSLTVIPGQEAHSYYRQGMLYTGLYSILYPTCLCLWTMSYCLVPIT